MNPLADRALRENPAAIPDLPESTPGPLKIVAILTGVEPSVMAASWYSDQMRAIWLIGAMGFIGLLQWLVWATVASQLLGQPWAIMIGLIPPCGLLIFDRLVILPSLWEVGPESRQALALPAPAPHRQVLSFLLRLLVSLAFAWVAAQYLTLALESHTLRARNEADRAAANAPLLAEYRDRKERHYQDTVQALTEKRSQLLAEIRHLESSQAEAERQRLASAKTAADARLEKGREEDGFSGDGRERRVGRGQKFRDAERQEAIAQEQAALHIASLNRAANELARARAEYRQVDRDATKAIEAHEKEAERLERALANDPRYVKEGEDLLSLRLALKKLQADPDKGALVNMHTLEMEILVVFLDLLLLFVKWAPHNDSYGARLVAKRRLEAAGIIREANRDIGELRQQRPDIRIVREE